MTEKADMERKRCQREDLDQQIRGEWGSGQNCLAGERGGLDDRYTYTTMVSGLKCISRMNNCVVVETIGEIELEK